MKRIKKLSFFEEIERNSQQCPVLDIDREKKIKKY